MIISLEAILLKKLYKMNLPDASTTDTENIFAPPFNFVCVEKWSLDLIYTISKTFSPCIRVYLFQKVSMSILFSTSVERYYACIILCSSLSTAKLVMSLPELLEEYAISNSNLSIFLLSKLYVVILAQEIGKCFFISEFIFTV